MAPLDHAPDRRDPADDLASQVQRLDDALPQTQCTRCGYPDCRGYAEALAGGHADIDRCPPGGAEGVRRLAALTGRPVIPLNPVHGHEGPRNVAWIDEDWCIGCTLCVNACPVDAIVGTNKQMHTVIEADCTGCELCLPVCPVDCIVLEPVGPQTGWAAWSPEQAAAAQQRYQRRQARRQREAAEQAERLIAKGERKLAHLAEESRLTDPAALDRKRAVIEAALARARQRRTSSPD